MPEDEHKIEIEMHLEPGFEPPPQDGMDCRIKESTDVPSNLTVNMGQLPTDPPPQSPSEPKYEPPPQDDTDRRSGETLNPSRRDSD